MAARPSPICRTARCFLPYANRRRHQRPQCAYRPCGAGRDRSGTSRLYAIPDACLVPSVEAVHASRVRPISIRNIRPWRPMHSRQKIPFRTCRSSTPTTLRILFGSKGAITDHSKSVKSKRAVQTSNVGSLNHCSPKTESSLWACHLERNPAKCEAVCRQIARKSRNLKLDPIQLNRIKL